MNLRNQAHLRGSELLVEFEQHVSLNEVPNALLAPNRALVRNPDVLDVRFAPAHLADPEDEAFAPTFTKLPKDLQREGHEWRCDVHRTDVLEAAHHVHFLARVGPRLRERRCCSADVVKRYRLVRRPSGQPSIRAWTPRFRRFHRAPPLAGAVRGLAEEESVGGGPRGLSHGVGRSVRSELLDAVHLTERVERHDDRRDRLLWIARERAVQDADTGPRLELQGLLEPKWRARVRSKVASAQNDGVPPRCAVLADDLQFDVTKPTVVRDGLRGSAPVWS